MPKSSFAGAADRIARFPATIVVRAAERFDTTARETASRAVGGTLQLHSRGGRRPAVKLRTYTKYLGEGLTARAFVRPKPVGVWRWLEDGTKPHEIGARISQRTGRRARTRARFLYASGYAHPIRAPIHHPGSRGKKVWTRAVAEFNADNRDFLANEFKKVINGR